MANSFKNEIEDMIDDIVKEDKKRIELAFKQIKKKTEIRIRMAIERAMIGNYYGGYDPLKYVRTYQLDNSVDPLIVDDSDNSGLQFAFGIKTSPPKGSAAMRHDKLTIRVTNKKGEEVLYTYNIKNYTSDIEKKIFNDYFMMGKHPNAVSKGITTTPTTNVYKEINKALDDLLEDGIIDKIIQDVFSK